MEKKYKILEVNASKSYGGVSAVIYNYYKHMNKEDLSFDFLSPNKSSFISKEKEIISNKDNIYGLNINSNGYKYYIELYKKIKLFLKSHKYSIIHINSGLILYNAIVAYLSKKYTNSIVITHSHSAYKRKGIKRIISYFLRRIISNNSDYLFACSKEAAYAMFPKKIVDNNKYTIIYNGIDPNLYKYNEKIRNKIRKELKIEDDCLLLGSIARLEKIKNHNFMLELLERLLDKNINTKLLLVGDGSLRSNLEEKVSKMNLKDNVIFLGMKDNAYDYYNAMDILLLPSFNEGFGITAIEAQANGLNCLVSNTVPKDIKITELVSFLELNSLNKWVEEVIKIRKQNYKKRADYISSVRESNYNLKNNAVEFKKMIDLILR